MTDEEIIQECLGKYPGIFAFYQETAREQNGSADCFVANFTRQGLLYRCDGNGFTLSIGSNEGNKNRLEFPFFIIFCTTSPGFLRFALASDGLPPKALAGLESMLGPLAELMKTPEYVAMKESSMKAALEGK